MTDKEQLTMAKRIDDSPKGGILEKAQMQLKLILVCLHESLKEQGTEIGYAWLEKEVSKFEKGERWG